MFIYNFLSFHLTEIVYIVMYKIWISDRNWRTDVKYLWLG